MHNETLTYFAGGGESAGVMLSFAADMGDLKTTALVYRHGRWEDATAEYLSPLKVGGRKDFLILPQFGRTARVLTYDPDDSQPLRHRGWLVWDGKHFLFSAAATRVGWRCPDHERRVLASYFGTGVPKQLLPDFCRVGGDSGPDERVLGPAK